VSNDDEAVVVVEAEEEEHDVTWLWGEWCEVLLSIPVLAAGSGKAVGVLGRF
jgi:hypothetical protein